jgi:cytidylate kinase
VDINEILSQIIARDTRDASRAVGPLAIPAGARVIDSTQLTQEQVIEQIVNAVRSGMSQ